MGGAGVPLPRPLGPPLTQGRRGGATGRDAGGYGVVDALPGQRVHQAGGVAHEQYAAGLKAPARRRERQVVPDPVPPALGGAGQELLEALEQLGTGRRRTVLVEELAVPDVRKAVTAVEGPGVRRLVPGAELDDLRAAPPGSDRGVAAQR